MTTGPPPPRTANAGAVPLANLSSRVHLPVLVGIRGIAVFGVMVGHFVEDMHATNGVDRLFFYGSRLGSCGVDLFFVLSGFLITGILLDSKGGPRYFSNFYSRRTLRIFPLYYLMLVLGFYVWPHVIPKDELGVLLHAAEHKAWYWLYVANWLFAFKGEYQGLTGVWSLGVEEQFYVFWPLIVFLLPRRALAVTCIGFIIGAVIMRCLWYYSWADQLVPRLLGPDATPDAAKYFHTIGMYVLTPMRMDGLCSGALLACLVRGPAGIAPLLRWAGWIAAGALAVLIPLLLRDWGKGRTPTQLLYGATPLAWFFAMLLLMGVGKTGGRNEIVDGNRPGLWTRVFNLPILRFFGKYSYAMYLLHPFVLSAIDQFVRQDEVPKLGGLAFPGMVVYIAIGTALTVAVSWISWHAFEKHFLALKRFFEYGKSPGGRSSAA